MLNWDKANQFSEIFMKLRFALASPYVRTVMATALECGLGDQIEKVDTNVWAADTDIGSVNPLGKVPALATDDGRVLCDSPVICEYLDSLHDGNKLYPAEGIARWDALNLAALAKGIMDAAVGQIIEIRIRPEEVRWQGQLDRQKGKIAAALDNLETQAVSGALKEVTIGTVTLGCALGYLDFRFPEDGWRNGHPALDAWYMDFSNRPAMLATRPS